jgi:hypothetical protein
MHLNKVIFAIDDNATTYAVAKFMRHIDTARAMGTLKGPFVQCIGMYDGVLEPSYMMDERDYLKLVAPMRFVNKQESVLHVPGDTRQPCTLVYSDNPEPPFNVGPMREVTALEAFGLVAWTYVLSTGKYFTTINGDENV